MHIANFIIVGVFVINIVLMDVKIILAKSIEVRVIEVRGLAPVATWSIRLGGIIREVWQKVWQKVVFLAVASSYTHGFFGALTYARVGTRTAARLHTTAHLHASRQHEPIYEVAEELLVVFGRI